MYICSWFQTCTCTFLEGNMYMYFTRDATHNVHRNGLKHVALRWEARYFQQYPLTSGPPEIRYPSHQNPWRNKSTPHTRTPWNRGYVKQIALKNYSFNEIHVRGETVHYIHVHTFVDGRMLVGWRYPNYVCTLRNPLVMFPHAGSACAVFCIAAYVHCSCIGRVASRTGVVVSHWEENTELLPLEFECLYILQRASRLSNNTCVCTVYTCMFVCEGLCT